VEACCGLWLIFIEREGQRDTDREIEGEGERERERERETQAQRDVLVVPKVTCKHGAAAIRPSLEPLHPLARPRLGCFWWNFCS